MGSNTFQLSRLFWVVPNLSSLASCHPAADGHSGPAPRCDSTRWPSTWGFVCPARRYLQLHLSAETQWKQGRADVFKLDMSRVEILSPALSSATWFVLRHHWNSQSRSEAQPCGSEEVFKQQLPPPTLASVVSSYPLGFSRNKICSHLAFLEKASRDVWSASSACSVSPHALLLLSDSTLAWERQPQISCSFHMGMHSAFRIPLLFRGFVSPSI